MDGSFTQYGMRPHRRDASCRTGSFGCRRITGTGCVGEMIDVRLPDGQVINALTYTVKNPKSGLKTNKEYVGHIVAGLREHNVSEDYIARVKAISTANNPEISAAVEKL